MAAMVKPNENYRTHPNGLYGPDLPEKQVRYGPLKPSAFPTNSQSDDFSFWIKPRKLIDRCEIQHIEITRPYPCLHIHAPIYWCLVNYNGVMPFTFSDEKIEELRLICEQNFGQDFSTEEARVMSNNLLELYRYFCELERKRGSSSQTEQEDHTD